MPKNLGEASRIGGLAGVNYSEKISINEDEIILASICYNDENSGSIMRSLTSKFYNNLDENIKEIEGYKLVYLVKIKFYKENPNK